MGDKKQAFDTKRFSGFYLDVEIIKIVGFDCPLTDSTRHLYDKGGAHEPVDEATVLNMMVYGCVEPIIITKIGPDAFVVDGRGRIKNLREANKRLVKEGKEPFQIPAVLQKGNEHKLFGVMVSANGFRRKDDQMTKAEKVQQFLDLGRDTKDAAVAFGVSETAINQWLVLLDLAPPVKKMVRQGKLSAHAASKLASLPADKQVEKAKEALAKARSTGSKVTGKTITTSVTNNLLAPPKRLVKSIVTMEKRPHIKPEHDNFWSALRLMMGELSLKDVGLDETAETILEAKAKAKAEKVQKAQERKDTATKKKAGKEKEKTKNAKGNSKTNIGKMATEQTEKPVVPAKKKCVKNADA